MGIFGWLPHRGPKPATPDDAPEQTLAIYTSQPAQTAIIVTLIGIEAEQIDEIIDVTARRFGKKHKIVYLTDSLDFMRFRDRNAIFEYLPSALEQKLHAAEICWNAYLARRWRLLLSKWQPVHVISYGRNIDAFLAAAPPMTVRTDR
ncbi:hypothetical protein [Shinella sp. HZN7]|uniref:hypothetical protein n=1 Tax=Shinella sp. (strain HZN7) TaxID=879274 RepID=UPI0007DA702E|nr:hypothetical protein [Shinella sp. HZN7]ANH07173.1 hypothetical protein shn_23885 [Shinella sp. HZN7]